MMRHAGPLLDERAFLLLRGTAQLRAKWVAEVSLFQALRRWNATQVETHSPVVANVALMAQVLADALQQDGFDLSGIASGQSLVFDASEIEALICRIVDEAVVHPPIDTTSPQVPFDYGNVDRGNSVNIDRAGSNVVRFDSDPSESAVNGPGHGQ